LYYCRHSANPIGYLVLHLFGEVSGRTVPLSDAICTGLQLTNFWQDLSVDWRKGRLYVPLEDLDRFGYTESDLLERKVDDRFRSMMEFEVCRTREIFARGKPLLREATPRLRFELELTYRGGIAILDMISSAKFGYDVLTRRPALSSPDKAVLLIKALMRTQV
jgi:phytoene/squalene synthetase